MFKFILVKKIKMYKIICSKNDIDYSIYLLSSDSTDNDGTANNMTFQNQTKTKHRK